MPSPAIALEPGMAHVGCTVCGFVTTSPLDPGEAPPWCIHNHSTVVWRDPHHGTQQSPRAWTRMVRVTVEVAP